MPSSDSEYLDEDVAEIVDKLAKEIATVVHGWGAEDQPDDEGIGISANSMAELGIPSVKKLARMSVCIVEIVYNELRRKGVRYDMAINQLTESDEPTTQSSVQFTEVDIATALNGRPRVKRFTKVLFPTQEMANAFSKELPEAQMASPPLSPFRTRPPVNFPRSIRTPFHPRLWEGEMAR